jgi:N-acetylmuramoyl-L-alanine amidase
MDTYTVGAGESLASIAKENGYLWKTIWDHPGNAALRKKRTYPNQLMEGDELVLPDKGARAVDKPTDARHQFKRKGEPTRLKLQLLSMGEPRKNEAYTLTFGGQVIHGNTDAQGRIDHPVPGEAKSARLLLANGSEAYDVAIGGLDPIESVSGVQHRLSNLGYDCGGESGEAGDATRAAVLAFQRAQKLKETGVIDDATRARLRDRHG